MIIKMLFLTTAALLLSFLRPDELRRERLPADVDFVLHLDIEGLKQTQLWKAIQEHATGEHGGLDLDIDELDELKTRFGLDPFTDVKSLTVFKLASEEDPTVALFSTTEKIDDALRALQKEPSYRKTTEQGIELYSWQDPVEDGEDSVFAYLHAPKGGERVAVVAANAQSAVRAARVLRGEEKSLAGAGGALSVAPAPGSFLYVAASTIPGLDQFTPASRVFGLAQGIQVDLGEAGGLLRGHLGVVTGSPEDARNVADLVQGLIALGNLAAGEEPELGELLRALRINTKGSEVSLDMEYSVSRLIEMLQEEEQTEDEAR